MFPAAAPSRTTPQRLLPLRGGRPVLIAAGLALTLCAGLLLIFSPLFIQETELRLYDLMLAGRAAPQKSGVPVIVGIDEESLKAYGQWPWPRYRLARLVERLGALGAKVVVLDFLMPEPDRTSPDVIMAERRRDLGPSPSPPPAAVTDVNSQRLAKALAGGPTILGYYLDLATAVRAGAGGAPRLPAGMVVAAMPGAGARWPTPTGMIRGIGTLTAAAGAEGFTNAQHDLDGVLRRVPLLMHYEGAYYPSLALGAVLLASQERRLRIDRDASETVLSWGERRIPLDRLGDALIDFRTRDSFPYFSARAILDGHPAAGSLRGKIVLIGAWAKGLGDVHQVPSGQELHGVEAHAAVIDTILSGTFIAQPTWARGAGLFAVLLLGGLSTWLLSRPGYVLSLLAVMGMSGGCYWGARALLLSREGLFIPPLIPMATPLLVMTALSLMKYGIEARKVQQRNRDLMQAQDTIIVSMSTLTAARDKESGQHILRTQRYVEVLARQLATLPGYAALDEANIKLLAKSAPLHDIGKVGIPDHILCKPGALTPEEYDIMKTHTLIGAQALSKTMGGTEHPEKLAFLNYALQMAASHHEKWDGSGYPLGLSGTDIPLAGRLMALADVYDALVSRRVYKRDFSHEEAKEWILARSGSHFDPEVVGAFVAQSGEFIRIARELADEE
ncbi:CHASE2 domain-containing protein [Oryzomonas sagensis]|uniref:CHASE2 domain-containing protein n=1 Tax=Oryzomonas sagensis TaxID=2603857 RepID=A0ABQ6TN91_9BACT|nr:CHASE2 domain-containing protein [Oryzomonas sagensis]KAB0670116.1 CHASE2 domain-containing protein [Oryzomonas sagensis]